MGMIIPLYTYPTDSSWSQVIQAKAADPAVQMIAIINPDSGPGASANPDYQSGIQKLQSVGITVLGYVYTSYGARPINAVEADILDYEQWYHVNGIMFDEMASATGYESYYSSLNSYVQSLGMTYTVGNAGTAVAVSYIGVLNKIIIYENASTPSTASISALYPGYDSSNFAVIGYGVPEPSSSYLSSLAPYVSAVYFTDTPGPNPYDTLPTYFSSEVAMLNASAASSSSTTSASTATSAVTSTVTSTVTGTAITATITSVSTTTATTTQTASQRQSTTTVTVISFLATSTATVATPTTITATRTLVPSTTTVTQTVTSTRYVTSTVTSTVERTTATACSSADQGRTCPNQYGPAGTAATANGSPTALSTSPEIYLLAGAAATIGIVLFGVRVRQH